MEFKKIQLTKKNTLNVVYSNVQGDLFTVNGANIVHRDLKQALNALIPHIALMTEQREADGRKLKELEAQRITDANSRSVFKLMGVDSITLAEAENVIGLSGYRILQSGDVISLTTPNVNIEDKEKYRYCNELACAVEGVKFEAKAYLEEQKWGIKEGNLDFGEDDPFKGVDAGTVPEANLSEEKPKKRGRKSKVA